MTDRTSLVAKLMGIQELCNHELATYPLGSDVIGLAEAILDLIRAD